MAGAERAACKEPELSSAHGHTRITPICRTVIREKGQSQHRSSTTKDIKKQPRPDEEGRPALKSVHDPRSGRGSTAGVLPWEPELGAHRALQPRVLPWGEEPSEH